MPQSRRIQAILVTLLLFLTLPLAAQPVEYFTDNGYGNPVATMQHPSGEFINGSTYLAYQGPHEDPYVVAYHHDSKSWAGPFKAGINVMGQEQDAQDSHDKVDNHGKPAMIIDAKGYIHLAFGGHGGSRGLGLGNNNQGAAGRGKQTHVVSKKPYDITEWEALDNISPFGTYSQFIKMDNGDIYLFFRHGSHQSDWVYQRSTDHGRTFADPLSVLKSKPQPQDPDTMDAWYAWFEKGLGDTITASYVYHPCNKRGRHSKDRHNTYYMQMNTADATWTNAPGQTLAMPILKEYADENTLMFDTHGGRANHGTCRVDENGAPHVFFRHDDGHVRYYRWLGDKWQQPVTVLPGNKSQDGDMIVHSPMHISLLLRYKNTAGSHVGYFNSTDGGLTWQKAPSLLSAKNIAYNPISSIVRNAHPNARVMLSSNAYGQVHQYRNMVLLGDQGPVTRPKQEASNLGNRLKLLRQERAKGK
ncbi:hypothetical protein SV7mr_30470 [Stieleria bergensis]|uniref:BNR/Asp-box repeat protein n=1 Tax=Stieleria bergensis TaxID=2528025 RepID=A0A517SWL3_9BACT|nr:hypothetical protein SV7mr_30470 [Planctomycetes bacterium SV_7m_r]